MGITMSCMTIAGSHRCRQGRGHRSRQDRSGREMSACTSTSDLTTTGNPPANTGDQRIPQFPWSAALHATEVAIVRENPLINLAGITLGETPARPHSPIKSIQGGSRPTRRSRTCPCRCLLLAAIRDDHQCRAFADVEHAGRGASRHVLIMPAPRRRARCACSRAPRCAAYRRAALSSVRAVEQDGAGVAQVEHAAGGRSKRRRISGRSRSSAY
jgi:hypothetical protein